MPPLPHSERLLERLRKQREKGLLCDCTVAIGQSMFQAHWNVLAAFSGYFNSLSDASAIDKTVTSLDPECVNEGVFEKLMDYVYSGYLDVDSYNVTEICKAATFLKMEEVVVQCTLTLEDIKPICSGASPPRLRTAPPHQSEAETGSSLGGFQGPLPLETEEAPSLGVRVHDQTTSRDQTFWRRPCHQGGTRERRARVRPLLAEAFHTPSDHVPDVPGPGLVGHVGKDGGDEQMRSRSRSPSFDSSAVQSRPPLRPAVKRERVRKSCVLKENCGSAFPDRDDVGDALAGEVKAKPVCFTCGKVFSEASSLRRHMRIHRGVKPYVCQLCDKAFTQCNQLKTHVRTHTGEKPYQCDLCQKGFAQKCQLVFHSRMHHGEEKPYKCDVCGLQFATSSNLKIHSRKHSGEKPYVCDCCGQRFAQASTLTYHVRRHTGEKPYVCDTCGKAFAVSSSLITHSRKHTGEKPYVCRTCGKSFTSCGELNKHCRSHTGEKPFICELCGNCYTDVKNLKKHKAKVHKDFPSPDPGQKPAVSPEDPVFWKATASSLVELKASDAPPPLSISVDHQTMIGPPPQGDGGSGVSIDQMLRTAIGYTEPQFIFLQQLN
ncbi:myoneurin isoform X2 [Conger conger]|uniref:myoneurin isoform X2 n=1 Tax=Conger conger TaxID=82655 RepID=UPI002A59D7FA|nr:myoneurin isoform X2 [Conger conger]